MTGILQMLLSGSGGFFAQTFTASGSYVVPLGVTHIDYLIVAGGGGGGS